jgi:hypothetical protein
MTSEVPGQPWTIGHMWGVIVTGERLHELKKNPHSAPVTPEERAFCVDHLNRVDRVLDISDSIGDSYLLISKQCPMGLMNDNCGAVGTVQCRVNIPVGWTASTHDGTRMSMLQFAVTTTSNCIAAGAEIFLAYNYNIAESIGKRKRSQKAALDDDQNANEKRQRRSLSVAHVRAMQIILTDRRPLQRTPLSPKNFLPSPHPRLTSHAPTTNAIEPQAVTALMLKYLNASAASKNTLVPNKIVNQIFLLNLMPLPSSAPPDLAVAINAMRARLQVASQAGEFEADPLLSDRLQFHTATKSERSRDASPIVFAYVARVGELRRAFEHLCSASSGISWKQCQHPRIHTWHQACYEIGQISALLVEEWISARLRGGEEKFLASLSCIVDFLSYLNVDARSRLQTSTSTKATIMALMYLATHVIYVQTDYLSKRELTSANLTAIFAVSYFLEAFVGVPIMERSAELLAECVAIFTVSSSAQHRALGVRIWHESIIPETRYPPIAAKDETLTLTADIDHFIVTLLHVYLTVDATTARNVVAAKMLGHHPTHRRPMMKLVSSPVRQKGCRGPSAPCAAVAPPQRGAPHAGDAGGAPSVPTPAPVADSGVPSMRSSAVDGSAAATCAPVEGAQQTAMPAALATSGVPSMTIADEGVALAATALPSSEPPPMLIVRPRGEGKIRRFTLPSKLPLDPVGAPLIPSLTPRRNLLHTINASASSKSLLPALVDIEEEQLECEAESPHEEPMPIVLHAPAVGPAIDDPIPMQVDSDEDGESPQPEASSFCRAASGVTPIEETGAADLAAVAPSPDDFEDFIGYNDDDDSDEELFASDSDPNESDLDYDDDDDDDKEGDHASTMAGSRRVSGRAPRPAVEAPHQHVRHACPLKHPKDAWDLKLDGISYQTISTTERTEILPPEPKKQRRRPKSKEEEQNREAKRNKRIALKFEDIEKSFAEIRICCGAHRKLDSHPPTAWEEHSMRFPVKNHPFYSLRRFAETRIARHKGSVAARITTHQDLLTRQTRVKSGLADERTVCLDGFDVCCRCYWRWSGVCQSTIRRVHRDIMRGREHIDGRTVASARVSIACESVAKSILAMITVGYADKRPDAKGGEDYNSVTFPFSTLTHFAEELRIFRWLRARGMDQAQPLTEGEKKAKAEAQEDEIGAAITHQAMRRALDWIEKRYRLRICIPKSKTFMQCNVCNRLDRKSREATSASQRVRVQKQRNVHLSQVTKERKEFERFRDQAKSVTCKAKGEDTRSARAQKQRGAPCSLCIRLMRVRV